MKEWERWDSVADELDAHCRTSPVEAAYRKTVATTIMPWLKGENTYLDVACGSGLLFDELLIAGRNPKLIAGVDNSPRMVELSSKRHANISIHLLDGDSMQSPSGSIDVVGAFNILSHVPDMRPILKEMWRLASKVILFSVISGQDEEAKEFWKSTPFIRKTFCRSTIEQIIKECCGENVVWAEKSLFPFLNLTCFVVFKPNLPESPRDPKHTVILGSYNRPKMIKRAIRSVFDQIDQDWQLIVADDGSNDETLISIHEEILGDPRAVFNRCKTPCNDPIRKDCSSRACQRINEAIQITRGKLIHYLADDDWYPPKRFDFFNHLFKDPALMCGYGRLVQVNPTGKYSALYPPSPCTHPLGRLDHNQVAHRIETLDTISRWPTRELGDYALEGHFFNILSYYWPFIGIDEVVAFKTFHPLNMQNTKDQSTSVREA